MSQNELRDYYDILEIPTDASHHEIVKAYHRAKETYDPDSSALYTMFTKDEANEIRSLVEEAYRILSNQAKRKEYDENFLGATHPDFASDALKEKNESESRNEKPKDKVVPEGFRRGPFGIYELDSSTEEEILSQTDFDGSFLQKVRNYQKISIEQMSKETRISRSYIAAVETNDYSGLPAAVFVRGFIIQICKILQLDGNKVASSYMSKFKKEE